MSSLPRHLGQQIASGADRLWSATKDTGTGRLGVSQLREAPGLALLERQAALWGIRPVGREGRSLLWARYGLAEAR